MRRADPNLVVTVTNIKRSSFSADVPRNQELHQVVNNNFKFLKTFLRRLLFKILWTEDLNGITLQMQSKVENPSSERRSIKLYFGLGLPQFRLKN